MESKAQCAGRILRPTQCKPCLLIQLVAGGTLEERMLQRQICKSGAGWPVVHPSLHTSELRAVFQCGDNVCTWQAYGGSEPVSGHVLVNGQKWQGALEPDVLLMQYCGPEAEAPKADDVPAPCFKRPSPAASSTSCKRARASADSDDDLPLTHFLRGAAEPASDAPAPSAAAGDDPGQDVAPAAEAHNFRVEGTLLLCWNPGCALRGHVKNRYKYKAGKPAGRCPIQTSKRNPHHRK